MSKPKSPPQPVGEQVSPGSADFNDFFDCEFDFSGALVDFSASPKIKSPEKGFCTKQPVNKTRSSQSSSKKSMGSRKSSANKSDSELSAVPTPTECNGDFDWSSLDLDQLNYQVMQENQGAQFSTEPSSFLMTYPSANDFAGWNGFGSEATNVSVNGSSNYSDQGLYGFDLFQQPLAQAPYFPGQQNMNQFSQYAPQSHFVNGNGNALMPNFSLANMGTWQQQNSFLTSLTKPAPFPGVNGVPGGYLTKNKADSDDEDPARLYGIDRDNRRKKYKAEKPVKDAEHSWLRTNCTTKGLTSRTGKINSYNPNRDGKYCETQHPVGTWRGSSGTTFNYTRYGELDRTTFTIKDMQEFLFEHPLRTRNPGGLTLWIQKTPADSGRRYPTVGSSRCRFQDCPAGVFNRSINVGHFRVAFDEQWETSKATRDPYVVAMYVHLYCLERFCNFADICQALNVRADNRELISEPKGKFLPALDNSLFNTADSFIKACKSSQLCIWYPSYPQHNLATPTAEKKHKATLTCVLTESKNNAMNNSKIAMMEARGLTPSNLLVNKGDLQVAMNTRAAESRKRMLKHRQNYHSRTKVPRLNYDADESSDSDDNEARARSERHLNRRRKASKTARTSSSTKVSDHGQDLQDIETSDNDSPSSCRRSQSPKKPPKRRAFEDQEGRDDSHRKKRMRIDAKGTAESDAVMEDRAELAISIPTSADASRLPEQFIKQEGTPIDPVLLW